MSKKICPHGCPFHRGAFFVGRAKWNNGSRYWTVANEYFEPAAPRSEEIAHALILSSGTRELGTLTTVYVKCTEVMQ